jgi:MFS family permease
MIPLVVGMGLFPILPLYATEVGATTTQVGLLYAVTYAASVAGITLTGWLDGRVPRKALFVAGGSLGVPALALLGQATALWQVVILTAAIWFSGAVTISLVNVFTGLISEGGSRGASFSLMFMAYPLGAVVGGGAVSQLVASYGYPLMFTVLAGVWAALPSIGLLGLHGIRGDGPARARPEGGSAPRLGQSFQRLLLAFLLSGVAINVSRLATLLAMEGLGFSASAAASTALVSGLIAAPLTLLIGALSDRLGHRRCLIGAYALAVGGAAMLLVATQLWHFWVVATLLFVAWCVNSSAASALAASTLPPEALGHGLPRLNAMDSVASILGFAGTGFLMDTLAWIIHEASRSQQRPERLPRMTAREPEAHLIAQLHHATTNLQ